MKKQMQTISCSKSMVGRVIGKNGETIRALQNFTGAIIQIDQSTDPMKVTVSGTTESVTLAISMVNDIVNGTFKGFAMLRQAYNEQVKSDSKGSQPVYAPGYGLIPPSQQMLPTSMLGTAHLGLTTQGMNMASPQMSDIFHSYANPQVKPASLQHQALMDMNTVFGKLSLGTGFPQTAAMPCTAMSSAHLSPMSSHDLLLPGCLPQPQALADSVVSPMHSSAAALSGFNDLGFSLPQSAAPCSLFESRMNLPSSFGMDVTRAGGLSPPLSGSISPELSRGWGTTGIHTTSAFTTAGLSNLNFPTDLSINPLRAENDIPCSLRNINQFLNTSSTGGSQSDLSETREMPCSARISPRNRQNNVLVLMDPNGRPFTMDISTGETKWIQDNPAGHFMAGIAASLN